MRLNILQFLSIFIIISKEILSSEVTCDYSDTETILQFRTISLYTCNLVLNNSTTYNNLNDISGEHTIENTDESVKMLKSTSTANLQLFTAGFCEKFENIEVLIFENVGIAGIDETALQNCLKLKLLHLIGNQLLDVPEKLLTENSELLEISISNNMLQTLPDDFFEMQDNLEILNLINNSISSLPDGIFRSLWKLQHLNLDGNKIETLKAEWFKGLENLIKLFIKSNRIKELPDGIFYSLKNLEVLQLNYNQLIVFKADYFDDHKILLTVDLSFNDITAIDEHFFEKTKVYTFVTEGIKCCSKDILFGKEIDENLGNCYVNFRNGIYSITKQENPLPPTTETSTTEVPPTSSYSPPEIETSTTQNFPFPPLDIQIIKNCGRADAKFSNKKSSGNNFIHGTYPWVAVILMHDTYHCGGVLVSNKKVVTTATCLHVTVNNRQEEVLSRNLKVILGAHLLNKKHEVGRTIKGVYRTRIHPDYKSRNVDVAVIILSDAAVTSKYIKPICLMDTGISISNGIAVSFGGITNESRQIHTFIQDSSNCSEAVADQTFCATNFNADDIGSGLFVMHDGYFYLRGILSNIVGSYGIFTDVAKFSEWIENAPINDVLVDED